MPVFTSTRKALSLGLGLSRFNSRRNLPGVASVSPFVAATNLYMAFGMKRIVSGYAGALFRLVRASDSAELDISCAAASDLADYATVNSFLAATTGKLVTIYDQSGGARHVTQAVDASRPLWNSAIAYNGVVPAFFTGLGQGASPYAYILACVGLSVNRQAVSVFQAVAPQISLQNNTYWGFRNSGANSFTLSQNYATHGVLSLVGAVTVNCGLMARAQPSILGITSGLSATNFYIREQVIPAGALTSGTANQFNLGSNTAGTTFNAQNRFLGMAVYSVELDLTTATTLKNALAAAFSVPQSFTSRVVCAGDSIMQGRGSLYGLSMPAQLALTGTPEIFNTGISGETLINLYTNRVADRDPLFTSIYGPGKCLLVCEAGVNDVNVDETAGATVYSGAATPWITSAKAVGFKVLQATLLPQTDPAFSGADETERQAYNALVVSNSAGADAIVNVAANAIMGPPTAPDNPVLYFDLAHPTGAGYLELATTNYAPSINAFL